MFSFEHLVIIGQLVEEVARRPLTSRIFSVQTILATTFLRLKTRKTHRSLMKKTFWHFLISVIPFKKETAQGKNTLNTYLFCCRPVWIPKSKQPFFYNFARKFAKTSKILGIFDFSTTFRSFKAVFKKLRMSFLRRQLLLSYKITRKVYKKVYKIFENKKILDFLIIEVALTKVSIQ